MSKLKSFVKCVGMLLADQAEFQARESKVKASIYADDFNRNPSFENLEKFEKAATSAEKMNDKEFLSKISDAKNFLKNL